MNINEHYSVSISSDRLSNTTNRSSISVKEDGQYDLKLYGVLTNPDGISSADNQLFAGHFTGTLNPQEQQAIDKLAEKMCAATPIALPARKIGDLPPAIDYGIARNGKSICASDGQHTLGLLDTEAIEEFKRISAILKDTGNPKVKLSYKFDFKQSQITEFLTQVSIRNDGVQPVIIKSPANTRGDISLSLTGTSIEQRIPISKLHRMPTEFISVSLAKSEWVKPSNADWLQEMADIGEVIMLKPKSEVKLFFKGHAKYYVLQGNVTTEVDKIKSGTYDFGANITFEVLSNEKNGYSGLVELSASLPKERVIQGK